MATAAGGSVADLGSRSLRFLSFCVLLAGEASPARLLRCVRKAVRIGQATSAAVPLQPLCPSLPRPCKSSFSFVPTTEGPPAPTSLPGLDLRVPSTPRHVMSPHFLLRASSRTSSLTDHLPCFPHGRSHPTHCRKGQVSVHPLPTAFSLGQKRPRPVGAERRITKSIPRSLLC